MIYAIKKGSDGSIESVYAWTDNTQPIPGGYEQCTASEYTQWIADLSSSVRERALGEQVWIQRQASLAAAMGDVFTAEMKSYVRSIAAIVAGAGAEIPDRPTSIMSAT